MKRIPLIFLSLVPILVVVLVLQVLGAPAEVWAQEETTSPEPPLLPSVGDVTLPEAPVQPAAVLEQAWTSPYPNDYSNSLAWGDYDLDGDLDLVVGNDGDNRLFRNEGGTLVDTLALACNLSGPDENTAAVAWADYDQDGDLDLAFGNSDSQNCVFRYDAGTDAFIRTWLADEAQNTRSIAWAGWTTGSEFSMYLAVGNANEPNAVYRYEAGSFDLWWTDQSNANTHSVAWGDYDNDGIPDLAMANFGPATLVYHNNQTNLALHASLASAAQVYTRDVAWGDFDADGDLDLALANGATSGIVQADEVYCNSGPGGNYAFTRCWTSDELLPSYNVAWGDYEGDGDIDLAFATDSGGPTRIYINKAGVLETTPRFTIEDEQKSSRDVTFADWDGDGDLEFSVAYFPGETVVYRNTNGGFSAQNFGPEVIETRAVAWGDWDLDGDLDLAVGNEGAYANNVYENDGDGGLALSWTAPATEKTRSIAWGDFDGDGDLDLAAGNGESNGGRANVVYRNNTAESGGSLEAQPRLEPYAHFHDYFPSNTYAVAWGDYDGDGDLDLASANYQTDQQNRIYINRHGVFTSTVALGPASDQSLSLAWGDFDADYDLDLLVGNYNGASRVYVNNNGSFQSITLPLPAAPCPADARSVAWADWDGDGDLDIALANGGQSGCAVVLAASGSGSAWTFSPAWQSTDTGMDGRALAWGDYDGDGDFDLAVGINGQFGSRNRVYRNTGGSLVKVWTAPFDDADPTRSVAWGDLDSDGDLDLATGNAESPNEPNRVYLNNWNYASTLFTSPAYLANDPIQVSLVKPNLTGEASFFADYYINGFPVIQIPYLLADSEYDRAFVIEPQVSWDGGGQWEAAWEVPQYSSGVNNLPSSPAGTMHVFGWDALHQLLAHQGIPFDPGAGVYVPFEQSWEEMDVAFRIVAWSNNDHGGPIQRPVYGSSTGLFRVDLRPEWVDSEKRTDRDVVHPGERVEFTIAITQTDHGMPPALILDDLPIELKMDRAPQWNFQDFGQLEWNTREITWTGALPWTFDPVGDDPTLAPPNPIPFEITFDPVITRPLTNGLLLENCAFIFDGLHEPFDRCKTIEISSTPQLDESYKLVNGVTSNTARPGDVLTYTLVLNNTGTDNARSAVMTDTIPLHTSWMGNLKASSGAASYASGTVKWQGDVKYQQPVTLTYTVKVDKPLPGGTVITNTFWLDDRINPPFYLPEPVTTVVQAPDLRTSVKQVSLAQAELGDTLAYTILMKNTGQLAAQPLRLTDTLPPGTVLITPTVVAQSGEWGFIKNTNTITWTGSLAAGAQTALSFSVKVDLPPTTPYDKLENIAHLEDEYGGPVDVKATTTLRLPDLAPSYKLDVPAQVTLGETITYTVVISNTGGYAPELAMNDPLPANSQFIAGSLQSTGGFTYQPGSNAITWQGDLDTKEMATATYAVTAGCPADPNTPVITNVAQVSGDVPSPYNLQAVTPVLLPNLSTSSLTVDAANALPGDTLKYTMVIKNSGGNAPAVRMTDSLPLDVTWTGAAAASRGVLSYTPGTRQVRWDGALGPNEQVIITFEVLVNKNSSSSQVINLAELWNGCTQFITDAATTRLKTFMYLPMIVRK